MYERGLEDPLARRKIQNRIAQRAYSAYPNNHARILDHHNDE